MTREHGPIPRKDDTPNRISHMFKSGPSERSNFIPDKEIADFTKIGMSATESKEAPKQTSSLAGFREVRAFKGRHVISGVPVERMQHSNWCGYATLSMLLQHHGYIHLRPEAIFRHIHGTYDPEKEKDAENKSPAPTLRHLAKVGEELSSGELQAKLLDTRYFRVLKKKVDPSITPFDVLNIYLIKREAPCIIRFPAHNVVAIGVDTVLNEYIINDPAVRSTGSMFLESVDRRWSATNEVNYPDQTSYLMLTFTKRKSAS